jgi:hypothetical protein
MHKRAKSPVASEAILVQHEMISRHFAYKRSLAFCLTG